MLLSALLLAVVSPTAPVPADLVLLGGNVVTVDPQRPRVTAVAVGGPMVLARAVTGGSRNTLVRPLR
jgi:hypothetical protein